MEILTVGVDEGTVSALQRILVGVRVVQVALRQLDADVSESYDQSQYDAVRAGSHTLCSRAARVASDANDVEAPVLDEVLGDTGALVAGDGEYDDSLGHLDAVALGLVVRVW